jgi:hypothetical protein
MDIRKKLSTGEVLVCHDVPVKEIIASWTDEERQDVLEAAFKITFRTFMTADPSGSEESWIQKGRDYRPGQRQASGLTKEDIAKALSEATGKPTSKFMGSTKAALVTMADLLSVELD